MGHAAAQFRKLLKEAPPLQIVGAINAYCAVMAENVGFKALYLSGAGVANASLGQPDLGVTTLADVAIDAERIIKASALPLLVDIDTGWDDIQETIQRLESIGVAAVHVEDQIPQKRCGHRPNKILVSLAEMMERIQRAVAARKSPDFFIMARSDALAVEGKDATIKRTKAYVAAGADGIFLEAAEDPVLYEEFEQILGVPILANMTEFGKSSLSSVEELQSKKVSMILYPLSAFRAMAKAAELTYQTILRKGIQTSLLPHMQTREELYEYLDYLNQEAELDNKNVEE